MMWRASGGDVRWGYLVVPGSTDSLSGEVSGCPGLSPGQFLPEKNRREQGEWVQCSVT